MRLLPLYAKSLRYWLAHDSTRLLPLIVRFLTMAGRSLPITVTLDVKFSKSLLPALMSA